MTKIEKIVAGTFAIFLIVGIWHGYPLPNVVNDEMYFVGGPLRAIANHTFVPGRGDVPYGTITYLLNFFMWLIVLPFIFVSKGFSVNAVQTFLLTYPFLGYILTRLLGAGIIFGLFILLRAHFIKWNKLTVTEASTLLIITFINILVLCLAHSGKVWVLSTALYIVSVIYALRAINSPDNTSKYACVSIVSAWAAFANLPIMGVAFLSLPWLAFLAYKNKITWKTFITANLAGLGILLFVVLINFDSIWAQALSIFTGYSDIGNAVKYGLPFLAALPLNLLKVWLFFPLHIILLVLVAWRGKREGERQSLIYAHVITYLIILSTVASWSVRTDSYVRYLLPLPFFLALLIATYKSWGKTLSYLLIFVSLVFGVRTIYLLSVPTTYTQALTWTDNNLSGEQALLINEVGYDFDLPRNKHSAGLVADSLCSTICHFERTSNVHAYFVPIVIDEHTDLAKVNSGFDLSVYNTRYVYATTTAVLGEAQKRELVASFTTKTPDTAFHSINSLGSYFDPAFWILPRLGRNIYIYKIDL